MTSVVQTALLQRSLEAVLEQVLVTSYGCQLQSLAQDRLPAEWVWVLPLVIDGAAYQLHLQSGRGLVECLLPRILGRAVSSEEVLAMASELPAEVCNLLGGRLAGVLGDAGLLVTLGTPSGGPTAESESAAAAGGSWSCDGQRLALSLHARSLG